MNEDYTVEGLLCECGRLQRVIDALTEAIETHRGAVAPGAVVDADLVLWSVLQHLTARRGGEEERS